ncbi:MAG: hypothetical protein NC320_05930 [Clostridium sp.]|nr:hypothetical protein [Clostridium sp.]
MKKNIKLLKCCIVGIVLMFIGGLVFGCAKDNSPYPNGGRDTHEQFGDRRFVILTGINPIDNMTKTYCLYDQKKEFDGQVEGNIINYIEISHYIYTIGTNGTGPFYEEGISDSEKEYYTKVNYETGDIIQDTDLNIFSDEDQKIFEDLSNSESPFKDK